MSERAVICDACGPPMLLVVVDTAMKPFAIALVAAFVLDLVLRGFFETSAEVAAVVCGTVVALVTLGAVATGIVRRVVRVRTARCVHR